MTTKRKQPMTDLLRKTVAESGIPLLTLQQKTGVERASIARFLRGRQSLRLDKADALADYFGLELVKRKAK